MTYPTKTLSMPPRSSYLAKRRLLEAAGWVCSPDLPSHHVMAARALRALCVASWVPFTSYRLSRAFKTGPNVAQALMGEVPAYLHTRADLARLRWGQHHTPDEIEAFAEQISPLKIPTPRQLWLLYRVICENGFWDEDQAADLMWNYLVRVLHAQRERPQSTKHIKHDTFEHDYLAVAALIMSRGTSGMRHHYECAVPTGPVQTYAAGRYAIVDRPFPPLKNFIKGVALDLHMGVQVPLQPDVLELITPRV